MEVPAEVLFDLVRRLQRMGPEASVQLNKTLAASGLPAEAACPANLVEEVDAVALLYLLAEDEPARTDFHRVARAMGRNLAHTPFRRRAMAFVGSQWIHAHWAALYNATLADPNATEEERRNALRCLAVMDQGDAYTTDYLPLRFVRDLTERLAQRPKSPGLDMPAIVVLVLAFATDRKLRDWLRAIATD